MSMFRQRHQGFTLLELLVVIAIIGILGIILFTALNSARSKGSDGAIKADVANLRSAAQLWHDTSGLRFNASGSAVQGVDCGATFTANTFLSDTSVTRILAHIRRTNGDVSLYCNIDAAGNAYAIAIPLQNGGYWCIDSTGVPKGTQDTGSTPYTALNGAVTAALLNNTDTTCN